MKKVLLLAMAVAMTASLTFAAPKKKASSKKGKDKVITVGYAQVGAESDWRIANTVSFQTTFTKENGYDLRFVDGQQKQDVQIKAIRDFIQQGVDYIVLAPIVETGWETVLQEAKKADIPVILSDRQIKVKDQSLYLCWVGGNFEKEGIDAANWLADYLKKKGKTGDVNLVRLKGTIGASAQVGRTKGFDSIREKHPEWKLLDDQTGDFTQSLGQEVMESFLKKYPKIDVVIAENDNMAFGAIDAIKAAGRTCGPKGDITIFSFDCVIAAFDAMIAGDLDAAFECNPLHGPRVDEIIKKMEAGQSVAKIQYVDEAYFDTSMNLVELKKTRKY